MLGLFLLIGTSAPALAAKSSKISRVTIRGTDIFDFETKANLRKFPYTWINALHIQTKERVIRQQLLFKEGDALDPFLLRETERNLRALPFIRASRCVSFPQRDGSTVVVVHVNDAWTTEPQVNLSGANKIDRFQIGFKEKNFLGLGKSISYFHTKKNDVTEEEYGYTDPNLLGTHWQAEGRYAEATNGTSRSVKVNRPFYATDVQWATDANHSHEKEIIEKFTNNVKVSEFEQTKEISQVAAGLKVGHSRTVVNHAGLRYHREHISSERTDKSSVDQPIPEPLVRQVGILELETYRNNFIEAHRLDKMTRVEDINLGAKLQLSPGYAPRDLTGKPSSTQLGSTFEKYTELGRNNLLFTYLNYQSRNTFKTPENEIYKIALKNYYQGWENQTFVVHTRFEWGERLDPDTDIELGSDNGLRAYRNVAFRGSKSWLFNLEDRMTFGEDVWDLFSIGGAAFFDTGYAWEKGRPVDVSQLRSSLGLGLRLGLTRSSSEVVIRMDVSYRLRKAPGDDADWVLSFGSGQSF